MYLVALYMCTKYVTFNEAGSLLKIIDLFAEHLDLDLEWQVQWSRVLPVLSCLVCIQHVQLYRNIVS